MTEPDLRHHGDRELAPGLLDLAVNVRLPSPPDWLLERLTASLAGLAAYPDDAEATAAVAVRHRRAPDEVLVTAGAAEAFTLLARALRPGVDVHRPVVVHPQFTEPEVALTVAGHRVERVLLSAGAGFALDPGAVPADADLVVVGNPTNPTGVLHRFSDLLALTRPGRLVVVDEAFLDAVPGEAESLAGLAHPGLVVVRSLTKTWGLAGLRAGYLLSAPTLVRRLRAVQPPWSVSTPALVATVACLAPAALAEAADGARRLSTQRHHLVRALSSPALRAAGLTVVPGRAPFVLVHVPEGARLRSVLRARGVAVRRGDTFPGLGPDWVRVAVRDEATTDRFVGLLTELLTGLLRTTDGDPPRRHHEDQEVTA